MSTTASAPTVKKNSAPRAKKETRKEEPIVSVPDVKKAKPVRESKKVVVVPVSEVVTDTDNEQTTTTTENSRPSVRDALTTLIEVRQRQLTDLKQELTDLKALVKTYDHEVKDLLKKKRAKKPSNPDRTPSGITKKQLVSQDMYKFLKPFGVVDREPVSMTGAVKYITTYIKENKLQSEEEGHKKEFALDKNLSSLFNKEFVQLRDPDDPNSPRIFTFIRIMTYIKHHFKQKQPDEETTA